MCQEANPETQLAALVCAEEESCTYTMAEASTMAQGTEVVLLSMDTQQTLTQTIAKGQGLLTAA